MVGVNGDKYERVGATEMNAPLNLLYPRLFPMIQEYRVRDEKLLPIAYQNIPGGRPKHDDWALFKSTPRIENAYRIPLPLKGLTPNIKQVWKPWDPKYPTAPGTKLDMLQYHPSMSPILHALIDYAEDGWSEFAFWHHDKWVPCVTQYKRTFVIPFVGKRTLKMYHGLKADVTVVPMGDGTIKSDVMAWLEPAMSLTKG